MQEVSAGILIYRIYKNKLQVLLGKNGGPTWKNRNVGAWNIPKGHIKEGESILNGAIREFEEETSLNIPKNKLLELTYIGEAKTSKNKKVVHIFTLNQDYAPNSFKVDIKSNLCETEFPKGSGNMIMIPELETAYYFDLETAKNLIFPYQKIFLERLEKLIYI